MRRDHTRVEKVETSVRHKGKHQKTERAVKLDPACEHVSDIKKLNRENRTVRVENAFEKKINDHIKETFFANWSCVGDCMM